MPSLDHDEAVRVAARERIVAFARPGKPSKTPFVARPNLLRRTGIPKILTRSQRFLKPAGVGLWLSGALQYGCDQEAGSA